jgi:hypothetical protein
MPNVVTSQAAGKPSVGNTTRQTPMAGNRTAAGYIAPIIGRVALRDVNGYFNFPLIKKGETVAYTHVDRAQYLGRLYELVAATEIE